MTEANAPDPSAAPAGFRRSPLGRRIVTVVAVSLVLALIVRDGAVIHDAVFTTPDVALPDRDCGAGVQRLRGAYAPHWETLREGRSAEASLASLDLELRALRALCAREGDASLARFTRLERWRYRAENQSHLWHDTLSQDTARAEGDAPSAGANP